ncbi:hypothetical protein [Sulfuracidifex metallicus]|uniref:hypothetical protein n=1 Tax=Sulfuracidifex metallicus TaxID=47303 RepID=UPI002274D151|nr:hypothetical protein [Sulfuracidifex metallicus]MCY0850660.1 hypothetical protein [Sulfuracidifex metallicus]
MVVPYSPWKFLIEMIEKIISFGDGISKTIDNVLMPVVLLVLDMSNTISLEIVPY